MSAYEARNDPLWETVEPSIEGYGTAIIRLLQQRNELVEICANVLLSAQQRDTGSLAKALADMQQVVTEVQTVWCEQCGDRPARHFGIAHLCEACQADQEEATDD